MALRESHPQINHLIEAIELGGLLTLEDKPVPLARFTEAYFQRLGERSPGGNRADRLRDTFLGLAGHLVVVGRPGEGTAIDVDFREDSEWILPLVDMYLALEGADRRHPALQAAHNVHHAALLGMVVSIGIALRRGEALQFEYTGSRAAEPETRRVIPLRLVVRGDRLILSSLDLDRKAMRQFLLLRMQPRITPQAMSAEEKALLTEMRDQDPYSDSLVVFQGGESREVLLRFRKDLAADLKREFFHESQKVEEKQDWIELRMQVNNPLEVFSLVSRYMASCELVEPEDWRDWYVGRLRNALQRHGGLDGLRRSSP